MSISAAALIMRSMYFLFHCSAYPFSSQSAAIKSSCSQPPFYAAVFSPFNSPLVLPRGGRITSPTDTPPIDFYIYMIIYIPHIFKCFYHMQHLNFQFSLFLPIYPTLPCAYCRARSCGGLTAAKRPGAQPPGAFSLSKKPRRVRALRRLALPLGELSSQMTERALRLFAGAAIVFPLRPRCARPPLPRGEARGAQLIKKASRRTAVPSNESPLI